MFALGGGIGGGVAKAIGQKAVVSMLTKAGAKAALKEFGVKAATTGITNAAAFGLYDAGKEGIKQAVSGERAPRKVLAAGIKGLWSARLRGLPGACLGKGLVAATGRLAGEAAGLTGAGAFVEGHKPTAEDFLVNAATLGVIKGTGAAVGKALPKHTPKEPASMLLSDAPLKPPAPKYGKTTPLGRPSAKPEPLTTTTEFIGDMPASFTAGGRSRLSATRPLKPIIKLGDDRVGRVFDEMPKAEGGEGAFRKFITDWVSKTEPLGVFRRRLAKKGATLRMESDPEMTMRMAFSNADLNGARWFDTNIVPHIRGLSTKDYDVLRDTIFALMVRENRKVDPKRFNDYALQRLGTSIERVNEAVAAMDSYRTADGKVLRQVVDELGRKGTGATWRNAVETRGEEWAAKAFGEKDYYFPLYRKVSGRKVGTYGEPDLLADPVRNITGLGQLKIEDPLISVLGQSMAQRRYAAEQTAIGQMLALAKQNNWPELAQVLKKGQANLPGEYSYKGQVVRLDPEIARSLIAMQGSGGWGRLGFVEKWATMPTRVLRKGVTLAPEFWIRNIFRDVYSATIMSRYGFTPVDFVRGFSSAIKQDQHFKEWVESNGPSATWVSMDKNMLMTEYTRMLRGEGVKGTAKYIVQHPFEFAAMMSEMAENATRIGAHRKARAKGATQIQAGFESRDVSVDFKRSGVYGQIVNQLVPFWNANIQGWDKFTRTFIRDLKADPKRAGVAWLKAGTLITAPSVALALANSRDPRWKDIPDWQKNAFWIVMTDDHIWRIPKPFELGMLFGSVPERFAEYVVSKDPTQLDAIMSSLGRNVGDVGGLDPTNPSMASLFAQVQPIGPAVEVMANRNTFTGGPVVPQSVQRKPPAYQKAKWTRRTFTELGERLGYSPAKLEYLWEGYSGTLGKYAADTSDAVLNALDPQDGPPKPKAGWSEVPFIRAFVVRHPSGGGRLVNQYYDLVADNESKWSVREDLRGRERAEVERVHRITLANQKLIKAAWDRIERVEQARTLTPEAKREKIDAEYYRINRLAEQALDKIGRR